MKHYPTRMLIHDKPINQFNITECKERLVIFQAHGYYWALDGFNQIDLNTPAFPVRYAIGINEGKELEQLN